jgi:hypothetical protein
MLSSMIPRRLLSMVLLAFSLPLYTHAHERPEDTTGAWIKRISVSGYGIANYYAFNWQTDPQRRNAIDIERLVLYTSVRLSDNLRIKSEIEFEHGGTGVAMEFDRFEEFGEYEMDVEKGGEVMVEQLNIEYKPDPRFGLRAGRIKVPLGLMQSADEPYEYYTPWRSEMESAMLPSLWYENGIEIFGDFDSQLQYSLMAVDGLDGTGFSSAGWISGGHQKRFEMVNVDDIALAARVDYDPFAGASVGAAGYFGNTVNNRPKPDMSTDAHVAIVEGHVTYTNRPLTVRAMGIYGTLQNADLVSKANRNLSNNLNAKRTPVGSAALGWYVEAGYDVLSFFGPHTISLDLYTRYEFYDTMAEVTGDIFDNPRWERQTLTVGAMYRPLNPLVVKTAYAMRKIGTATANEENTFALGFGFEF